MKLCYSCKKEIAISGKAGRSDTCLFCGSDLKVCLNCRFYDKSSANECREPSAEKVLYKDKANFCEYFEFRASEDKRDGVDPMKKLKDLFKD